MNNQENIEKPKIILLGAEGQLGSRLQLKISEHFNVVSYSRKNLDITDYQKLEYEISKTSARIILNAAAYTNVDGAEKNKPEAMNVNYIAVKKISELAKRRKMLLVHFSTDYIYDGVQTKPYTEADQPNPLNEYGRSKLAGEIAIKSSGCNYLIIRTSWIIDSVGQNFIKKILEILKHNDSVKVVSDQSGVPTSAEWLSEMTLKLITLMIEKQKCREIYNIVPEGATTWFAMAEKVIEKYNEKNKLHGVNKKIVIPIMSSDILQAKRPRNSILDINKIEKTIEERMPNWQLEFDRILEKVI